MSTQLLQTKIAPARVLTTVKKPTGIIVNTSAIAAKQLDVTPAKLDSSQLLLRTAVLETKKKEADIKQAKEKEDAEKAFVTSLDDGSYFAEPTGSQPAQERDTSEVVLPASEPAPAATVESEAPGAGDSPEAVQVLVQAMTEESITGPRITPTAPLVPEQEDAPKSKLDQIIDWLKADKIRFVLVMAAFGLVIYAIVKAVKK